MSTRRTNLWPWAFALAVISGISAMQHLDNQAADFDTAAAQERREWMQAVAHCHRAFGPQTAPEYDDHDHLICVGKRGQRMAAVPASKASDVKVASAKGGL